MYPGRTTPDLGVYLVPGTGTCVPYLMASLPTGSLLGVPCTGTQVRYQYQVCLTKCTPGKRGYQAIYVGESNVKPGVLLSK